MSWNYYKLRNRGYYMAARRYEIYLRVLKKNFTIEPSERVIKYFSKYFWKIFKNILYYFKNSFLLRKGRFIM